MTKRIVSTATNVSLILLAPGVATNVGCLLDPAFRRVLSVTERLAIWLPIVIYFVFTIAHLPTAFPKSLGNLAEYLAIDVMAPAYMALRWRLTSSRLPARALALVVSGFAAIPCALYFLGPTLPE